MNWTATIAGWALAVSALSAHGAETVVYGKVLAVEAITDDAPVHCESPIKPTAEAGLSALLIWDLETRPDAERACRQALADRVQGYRVTYAYDGHEFVDILPQHPGARIPLRLSLE